MTSVFSSTEKRDFQRIPVDARASITGDGTFIACTISNVADDGAKVRLLVEPDNLRIAKGAEVSLNIPKYEDFSGRVIWIEDGYMGIQFDESQHVAPSLH
jgi:hypothetical protein